MSQYASVKMVRVIVITMWTLREKVKWLKKKKREILLIKCSFLAEDINMGPYEPNVVQ